ncbi:hypothetical protein [Bradyrhizobium canariense]|uniref:hypothetical protein n=1 Tax=Bradyrhizobium canariense TaxID=255045 RepID=UPI001302A8DE|nr:hypothetical protein [Bradyrhizobium canariense]
MKKPRPGGGVFEVSARDDEGCQRAQKSEVPEWGPFFEAIACDEIAHDFVIIRK